MTPPKSVLPRAKGGMSGMLRKPTALMTAWKAPYAVPDEVTRSYSPRSRTQVTLSTFSPRTICGRRPNLSATDSR